MSNYLSTPDPAAGAPSLSASGNGDLSAEDCWRHGGLPALRSELDRIDNAIHDLLMQRAEIVEYVARSGKPAAFRPGREASIIRRLLERHKGALPPASVVRIWRELLAATTSMQGGFSIAVSGDDRGGHLTQLAREHFGALTPLQSHDCADQALMDVSRGIASVAVLPYPSEGDYWWVKLLHHEPRLYIIGRLPFWEARPNGASRDQAVVVAATPADVSEHDRSFVGLECGRDISEAQVTNDLSSAGLMPKNIVIKWPQESSIASVLVEVEGSMSDEDVRLTSLTWALQRPVIVGTYAVPFAGGVL